MGPSRETHYGRYFDKIKESKQSTLLRNIDDGGHLRQIAEVLQNWEQKYDLLCLSFNPFDAVDALKRSEDRTRYSNF